MPDDGLFPKDWNLEAGRAARDRGMDAALAGAPDEWAEKARRAVAHLATRVDRSVTPPVRATFTSEDLIRAVGMPPTGDGRAVGAILGGAARRGIIFRVGEAQATRKNQHAARIGVWQGTGVLE